MSQTYRLFYWPIPWINLIQDGWDVHYIGDKDGIEYKEIQRLEEAVTFHAIATGKLRRYFSWQNLVDVFKVGFGILQSLVVIAKVRPQALFSKRQPLLKTHLLELRNFYTYPN